MGAADRIGASAGQDAAEEPAADDFGGVPASSERNFANISPSSFISDIQAARKTIVARDDDDRESFLRRRGFSNPETAKIIETVLREEQRRPETIYDFMQGIAVLARTTVNQARGDGIFPPPFFCPVVSRSDCPSAPSLG